MAKYYGAIGFGIEKETDPGVWAEEIIRYYYYGDVLRNNIKNQSSDKVNDDLNISNSISILSDTFANQNFHSMRFVEFMGTKWKITNIEVQYPRLVLTIGGVYNG